MTDKRKKVLMILTLILLAGEIIGLIICFINKNWNIWKVIKAYTQDSNILSLISAAVLAVSLYKLIKGEAKEISHGAMVFRYITTTMTTVTFLVVLFVLAPGKGDTGGFVMNFTYGSLFWFHGFCPVLALINFLFVEGGHDLRPINVFHAVIPTLTFAIVWMALIGFRILPDELAPYPFLRIHQQPWYMSVFWCIAINGVGAITATGLYFLDKLTHKKA